MGAKTNIQWTDNGATWTPIRARHRVTGKVGWHCTKPSLGCKFCYAEILNLRLGTGEGFTPSANVELLLDEKILQQPLHWRTPRKIFVCSMTDLFGEFVESEWIARVFDMIEKCPQHTFQILTKRPQKMLDFVEIIGGESNRDAAPKNAWLGVSVENQAAAAERIPLLLQTPAAVRFLSVEPLLEEVDLEWEWFNKTLAHYDPVISWVIVGGESGPHARPCNLEWIRSIVGQCQAAGVPVFVKQLGANAMFGDSGDEHHRCELHDRKGGDILEFPEDLRIREFPA